MRSVFVLLFLLGVQPASAQSELRVHIGFSDTAQWTDGERQQVLLVGIESDVHRLRLGFAVKKEGLYSYEGWGGEVTLGKRGSLPGQWYGTFRSGVSFSMLSASSAALHEGAPGVYRNWTWRTVALNDPFGNFTIAPFASYGLQRELVGRLFIDAQVRLSFMPTITQWAVGREGAMRATERRTWTWIPGYSVGIGYRF